MATTVPGQLLAAMKARKFGTITKLYAPGVDFQAWTPAGHWVASDPTTAGRIIEVWFTPGISSTIVDSVETSGARGSATLEFEMTWKLQPEDQPRTLRQIHIMTIKGDRIIATRIYCAGLHTDFPEVDLDKQRRAKGLIAAKPGPATKAVAAKAS